MNILVNSCDHGKGVCAADPKWPPRVNHIRKKILNMVLKPLRHKGNNLESFILFKK